MPPDPPQFERWMTVHPACTLPPKGIETSHPVVTTALLLENGAMRDTPSQSYFKVSLLAAIPLWLLAVQAPAADAPHQPVPKTLKASQILPQGMLRGEGFSVREKVSNDGFMNTYVVKSEYGTSTVVGDDHLRARLQEIRATKAIEELAGSKAFGDAAKGAAAGTVEGGKALVTSPVETTKGAVKGMGRWMGNVGRSVGSRDPYQENVVSTALGYDAAKRGYALEFDVDPYTDFEPFQEQLARVARADAAGGLITSVAMDVATEGTTLGTVVTVTSLAAMKDVLKDNPPGTLARINRKKLEGMGVPDHQIDAFLKNYNYTPTQATLLVEALNRMGNVKGREIFIAHASAAPDKPMARYWQQMAEMMANYVTEKGGRAEIISVADHPWLRTREGVVLAVIPVDYMIWSRELDDAERDAAADIAALSKVSRKEVWAEGAVDPAARRSLEARGWTVRHNVKLATRESKAAEVKPITSPGARGAAKVAPRP